MFMGRCECHCAESSSSSPPSESTPSVSDSGSGSGSGSSSGSSSSGSSSGSSSFAVGDVCCDAYPRMWNMTMDSAHWIDYSLTPAGVVYLPTTFRMEYVEQQKGVGGAEYTFKGWESQERFPSGTFLEDGLNEAPLGSPTDHQQYGPWWRLSLRHILGDPVTCRWLLASCNHVFGATTQIYMFRTFTSGECLQASVNDAGTDTFTPPLVAGPTFGIDWAIHGGASDGPNPPTIEWSAG